MEPIQLECKVNFSNRIRPEKACQLLRTAGNNINIIGQSMLNVKRQNTM